MKYSQPDFYHFSESSLRLVNYSVEYFKEKKDLKVLDLFAGSGVIGCEFSFQLKGDLELFFCEIQKEFIICIQENLKKIRGKGWIIEKCFQEIKEKDFDLIICNPPFFQQNTIREPYDKRRKKCMVQEGFSWESIMKRSEELLCREGHLIFLCHESNKPIFSNWKKVFLEKINRQELMIHLTLNKNGDEFRF